MSEKHHEAEPWRLTAVEALGLIREGELTIEDYAKSLLLRIEQRDPIVKAWVYLNPEDILKQARDLDAVAPSARGPLHGLPIGIKDIILTKDMPTQYNSPLYESSTPIEIDAPNITVLRRAGALIFGKTSTTEFASCHLGGVHQNQTSNAYDPGRTPGGSSSGSAAAVADYHVPVALGTQTAGSIVRPGSFNGVYAFKPTWGAISRENVGQYSITCDTLGFFARSARDFGLLSDVFDIKDDAVSPFALKGARIGFAKTHVWPKAGPGTRAAWQKAKELLAREGADVEEVELPDTFSRISKWHDVILASEGRTSFLGAYVADKALLHQTMRAQVENAQGFSRKAHLEASDGVASLRPVWDEFARRFDAVITPSVPDEAPPGLDYTGDPAFCGMWTVLHAPALTIPGFSGENGLPIGLSVVGPRYTDQKLVHAASIIGHVFESNGGWVSRNL